MKCASAHVLQCWLGLVIVALQDMGAQLHQELHQARLQLVVPCKKGQT